MLRDVDAVYLTELLSHRVLRYGSGLLHLGVLAANVALAGRGRVYDVALAKQAALPGARRGGEGRRAGARCRAGLLLRARDLGDGGLARRLPARGRPGRLGQGGGHALNRALDVAGASLGLALASPFLAASALAIKLEDRGPVLYRQRRVGRGRRRVRAAQAADDGRRRRDAGRRAGRSTRATRGSRGSAALLRRLSLDELPQLWNVVRGEMSLIGPRPTLAYQVERYTDRQRRRLEVKPGITGWAQIHGRAALPWDERIELDVWYVEHRSPRVDLKILLRTPLALFGGTYKGETGGWRA